MIGAIRRLVRKSFKVDDPKYSWYFGGSAVSSTGQSVTQDTAMRVSTVLACVRAIAEAVGAAPVSLVRADGTEVTSGPQHRLLVQRPTLELTSQEWREFLTASAVLTGRGIAYKASLGEQITELVPLMPSWVSIDRRADGRPIYRVTTPYGLAFAADAGSVLHIRGPMLTDDLVGTDVVRQAREAIGLAMATEETHARLHSNGVRPSAYLTTDQTLSEAAVKELRASFARAWSGASKTGEVPILDAGLQLKPLAMTGVDAQHIETRRFQIEEICRHMNVHPQVIMSGGATATYASAEAFYSAHLATTLVPWFTRWTGAAGRDVLENSGLRLSFNTRHFERATEAQRSERISRMVQLGVMTRNEARREMGLPALPGLDEPFVPVNLTTDSAARDAATEPTSKGVPYVN